MIHQNVEQRFPPSWFANTRRNRQWTPYCVEKQRNQQTLFNNAVNTKRCTTIRPSAWHCATITTKNEHRTDEHKSFAATLGSSATSYLSRAWDCWCNKIRKGYSRTITKDRKRTSLNS